MFGTRWLLAVSLFVCISCFYLTFNTTFEVMLPHLTHTMKNSLNSQLTDVLTDQLNNNNVAIMFAHAVLNSIVVQNVAKSFLKS